MKPQTISDAEYSARKRKTKREEFLEIMDEIIPWKKWVEYMTQTMEREVSVMCNLSKGVREKGVAEGLAKGHTERALSDLCNLMDTLGLTIEQAMAALKIPDVEKQKYMDLLERQS